MKRSGVEGWPVSVHGGLAALRTTLGHTDGRDCGRRGGDAMARAQHQSGEGVV